MRRLSMILLMILLLGLLVGCGSKGGESETFRNNSPSYAVPAKTSGNIMGEKSMPEVSTSNSGDCITSAESIKSMEDTSKMLEELEDILSSLDTIHDLDLIDP
ncbi:MAG TPA: hypothetical protein VK861_10820 [Bacteroidales bacterium]|nr:hypothetical protein [Bacteroidales bacterium]